MGRDIRRGLAWSTVNNLSVRMGNVVLGVVLARLLTPEEFGVFAVGLTCQAVLVTLADLGMSADLVRRGDIRRRAPVVALLALGVSTVLAALMVGFAQPIASALGSGDAAGVVRVLAITILLSGLSVVPYAVLQRRFMQARAFQADASALVVNGVVVVVLVLAGLGPLALAWSRVAGQVVAVILMFRFAGVMPRFGWDRGIARESVSFGAPLAVANLISWALLSVDYVVVGRTLGATELGLYVLAFNISAWPITAIGQGIRNVALPGFSQQAQDRASISHSVVRGVALIWTGGVLAGVLLSVLAVPLITSVYGQRWEGAAVALSGLALFGALRLVFDLFAALLVSRGANRAVVVVQVVWLLSLVPALVVGARMGGIEGVAFAHLVVGLVVVLPAYLLAVRGAGVALRGVGLAFLVPLLMAVPVALASGWVDRSLASGWLSLLVGGLVGTALYAAAMWPWVRRQLSSTSPGSQSTTPPRDREDEPTRPEHIA
ncbi:oligosaccharide flippase family protein [Aquipuribacter sp. MA13-6]|uniref:oligosaccharide flippase family protein n=1 Tax=unclassified Aquipuribacter TaxID=2635084 RepID=UPI003EE86EC8